MLGRGAGGTHGVCDDYNQCDVLPRTAGCATRPPSCQSVWESDQVEGGQRTSSSLALYCFSFLYR